MAMNILLVNSRSRGGEAGYALVRQELERQGIELAAATLSPRTEDLIQQARRYAGERVTILAGGGDGTLGAIAGELIGKPARIGVLPMGTGNSFARDLGIPMEIPAAVEVIAHDVCAAIDVARVEGRVMLNVATIGLTEAVAQKLTGPLKRQFGRLAYLWAFPQAYRQLRPFQAEIRSPAGLEKLEAIQVVIGNGRFHAGPFPVTRGASLVSGVLHAYAVRPMPPAEMLRFALHLPTGAQGAMDAVLSLDEPWVEVRTDPRRKVIVDGEVQGRTPIRAQSLAGALQVLVPEGFHG